MRPYREAEIARRQLVKQFRRVSRRAGLYRGKWVPTALVLLLSIIAGALVGAVP